MSINEIIKINYVLHCYLFQALTKRLNGTFTTDLNSRRCRQTGGVNKIQNYLKRKHSNKK